jgi:hypothetical protein
VNGKLIVYGVVQEAPHSHCAAFEGEAQPGSRGALGEMSGLFADYLQQGSCDKSERLPEVYPPLPAERD